MIHWRRYFYSTPALLAKYARRKGANNIALYGAGEVGIDVFQRIGENNIYCWVDRNFAQWPQGLLQKPVLPVEQLASTPVDYVLVCSEAYNREIYQHCRDAGIPGEKIILSNHAI